MLSVKFKRIFSKVVEVMLVILSDIKVSCIVFLSDCKMFVVLLGHENKWRMSSIFVQREQFEVV